HSESSRSRRISPLHVVLSGSASCFFFQAEDGIRDESDRHGMRIVIELKRGEPGLVILNNLYKLTPMQTTFGVINLAIVNGQPKVLSLIELLRSFIDHRVDVVRRRTQYDLRQPASRAHIMEGLKKALDHI